MKWIEPQPIIPSDEIASKYANSILLAELLSSRGIHTNNQADSFTDPEKYKESDPFNFPDMDRSITRIQSAIQRQEKIGIWGDFDVDGQTSTAVLIKALKEIGVLAAFHIPIRKFESHGIQKEYLEDFVKNEHIGLLITCDTGITENDAVQFANSIGLDVIISDHHTPSSHLPDAFSIINPKLLASNHPFHSLAGVGTAFQLVRALFEASTKSYDPMNYLDLVALGTVADLADLTNENRYYTLRGLEKINRETIPALSAMIKNANLKSDRLDESHISFIFSPRLNAAGRLGDANRNVDFLLTEDSVFAQRIANELDVLNTRRKIAVINGFYAAEKLLEIKPDLKNFPIILLPIKNTEPGIVGIVASMLVEKYEKPAIVLVADENIAKGSARSIEGVNIIQAISECNKTLLNFGGHPMAAGLSLPAEKVPAFREKLSKSVLNQSKGRVIERVLKIDSYLPFRNINDRLISEIGILAPFGSGNPAPILVTKNLEIKKRTEFGKTRDHLKILLKDSEGETREAIWWKGSSQLTPKNPFDLAYTVKKDSYSSRSGITLEWIDFQESRIDSISVAPPRKQIEIFDYRLASGQENNLKKIAHDTRAQLWMEGPKLSKSFHGKTRLELSRSDSLAILFSPSDQRSIKNVLDHVRPKRLFLLNISSPSDKLDAFLKTLGGMVKNCINQKQGSGNILKFAARLGQREKTIRAGLYWLEARGEIEIILNGGDFNLLVGDGIIRKDIKNKTSQLKEILNETSAFRSYYLRMDANNLIRLE